MTTPKPASTRPPWLRWLPVVLLLAAIGAQGVLMATVQADRQAGSGFAMFSSVDYAGSRTLQVQAHEQGGSSTELSELIIPQRFADDVDDLLRYPTTGRASSLADDLAGLSWSLNDEGTWIEGGDRSVHINVAVRGLTADGRELQAKLLAQGQSS